MSEIPDVRDGLTRQERVVLAVLHEIQQERGDRHVPTAMLWGRVCERLYISPGELSAMLARLGASAKGADEPAPYRGVRGRLPGTALVSCWYPSQEQRRRRPETV